MILQGYQVSITTWENDADHYKKQITSGLTLEMAKAYVDIAKMFNSRNATNPGFGNGVLNEDEFEQIMYMLEEKHPQAYPEFEEDTLDSFHYFLCDQILGQPEEYYQMYFCRVYDQHEVHYFPDHIPSIEI